MDSARDFFKKTKLAFSNRDWIRSRSGCFWMEQDWKQEWFLFTVFLGLLTRHRS